MLPVQLTPESFAAYPPQGRQLAASNIDLLHELPLGFVPFLLREAITYDWKFPAERKEFDAQLAYLKALTGKQRQGEMERFAKLQLSSALDIFDWVNFPAQFLEQLSAHLWATHQMDGFRAASEDYVHKFYASLPQEKPPVHRLGIVVIGQSVEMNPYPLFRKVRRNGVYFNKVNPASGLEVIVGAIQVRAAAHPIPYAHWYIDGARKTAALPGVACLAYDDLANVRSTLANRMLAAYESPKFDPEQLRTMLASTTPESVGLKNSGDAPLDRFALSLLTEGSGTQIYSTTFVQWAAREALRRAQPLTMLTRYTPRQKERTMDELLAGTQRKAAVDPQGSLIDADMGAYYTWLNQQRLSDAENGRFLIWFEGHNEAVAIAPGLKAGGEDSSPIDLAALMAKVS